MKIEMDDNSFGFGAVCVIALLLGCVSIGGCQITEQTKREAYKAGLVEKQVMGHAGVIWQKP